MDISLIKKVVAVAPEMGFKDLTVEDLTAALASGITAIEPFDHGFAVVKVENSDEDDSDPVLLILYVDSDFRDQGNGTAMLKSVIAKHATDNHMCLVCFGERLKTWFTRRGFRILDTRGEAYSMIQKPRLPMNRAKSRSDELNGICRQLQDYANRHPGEELQRVMNQLHDFALSLASSTVGAVRRKQAVTARQHRNPVTDEEIIAYRDKYHEAKGSKSNYGLLKAAVAHFEKIGKPINRDTIAARIKAIAE